MSADQIVVLALSLIGMAGIYWFFLGKKNGKSEVSTDVQVTVAGGYSPQTLLVPVGKPVRLTFVRTDPTACLEELVVPGLRIKKELPLNTQVELTITLPRPGKYPFHCGMNMYRGQIIAK